MDFNEQMVCIVYIDRIESVMLSLLDFLQKWI